MWWHKKPKPDTVSDLPPELPQLTGKHVRLVRPLAEDPLDEQEINTMLAMICHGEDPANRIRRKQVRSMELASYLEYVAPVYEQRLHQPAQRRAEGYRHVLEHPVNGLPESVDLRRPTGWDIDVVLRGNWPSMAERLSGLTGDQMDALRLSDYVAIYGAIDPLVSGS